jgi:hypothetical protein
MNVVRGILFIFGASSAIIGLWQIHSPTCLIIAGTLLSYGAMRGDAFDKQ